MAKYRTKIEVRRWTGGGWAWEVKGPLMDGENAFLVTADSGVLEPTKEEAFAAARRVAKQLNLEVEE